MQKAVVIGAGIAGLASAIRLRKKGYKVKVFEANDFAGGKMGEINQEGYRFDTGPSLFTMPHLVDELFDLHNVNPRDYFNYKKKDIICNYFWSNGKRFTAPADTDEFIKKASENFQVSEDKVRRYLNSNQEKYDLTANIFLKKSLHKVSTYLSLTTLKSLLQVGKLHVNNTLNEVNQRYFDDPHLVQLFNRYATYNGSSPYATPGIMSMIPHLEMHFGTYYPDGGMYAIAKSLYRLAREVGVEFSFNTPVEKIICNGDNVDGVQTSKGEVHANVVVSNMDIFATYHKLLPQAKKPKQALNQERSSSAIIFYWGINKPFRELDLHNILFSDNYQSEFEAIFKNKTLQDDPTVYINITSKEEESDAPPGCENWFVMINAPGNFDQNWQQLIDQARQLVIKKVNSTLHTQIENHIVTECILDPIQIEIKTSSHRGSLYGTSSNSKFAAFLRHPNFSSEFKNLYFCGGSVHPGGGIPLCLLSSKICVDQIN
ncbi:MAG: 1-hydroxycarotenoid 3,4-desaturase CrtD [Fulvivirga sp.]|nr:1-hydroxycarotenoid 3,4-desaturase CrtD [Fulvivirga sp.]